MMTPYLRTDSDIVRLMHQTVVKACVSLFADYNIIVAPSDDMDIETLASQQSVFGLIGFLGPVVRGMLGVGGPLSWFERVHPSFGDAAPVGRADICDWVGELSNQLLGRLSNTMATHRVSLSGGTPSVVSGDLLEIVRPRMGFKHFVFKQDVTSFSVWMHTEHYGEVPPLEESSQSAPQQEGEMVLF